MVDNALSCFFEETSLLSLAEIDMSLTFATVFIHCKFTVANDVRRECCLLLSSRRSDVVNLKANPGDSLSFERPNRGAIHGYGPGEVADSRHVVSDACLPGTKMPGANSRSAPHVVCALVIIVSIRSRRSLRHVTQTQKMTKFVNCRSL